MKSLYIKRFAVAVARGTCVVESGTYKHRDVVYHSAMQWAARNGYTVKSTTTKQVMTLKFTRAAKWATRLRITT